MIKKMFPLGHRLFGSLKRVITESIKQLLCCFVQGCLWEFETAAGA